MEKAFPHYKCMGNVLDAQGQLTRIWPKFNLVRDFMHVLVICKYKTDWIKSNREKVGDIVFPIISQWGLSVAMETKVLMQSVPKPYAAFPPPQ